MTSNRLKREYDSRAWRKLRRQVIERDGGRCRWHGCNVRTGLTVHHRNPYGPAVSDNLVTLCRKHHGMIDGHRAHRKQGRR